jgi:hypothetical protein
MLKFLSLFIVLMMLTGCSSENPNVIKSESDKDIPIIPQIIASISPTVTPTFHPLILGSPAPPVNLPVIDITPKPTQSYDPVLPAHDLPALVTALDSKPFRGTLNGDADITITNQLIDVTTNQGQSLKIAYRVPSSMTTLPDQNFLGSVTVADESTLSSVRKITSINDQTGLLFSEIYFSSKEPMTFQVTNDITVTQNPVLSPITEVSTPVSSNITSVAGTTPVATGQTNIVEGSAGNFQIHVEGSSYWTANQFSTDPSTEYRLRVWIIRSD